MTKHNIVLLNGKRRSGKGLLSQDLAKKAVDEFQKIYILSLAEPIKAITKPILDELQWDGVDKEIARPLWIATGEVGRAININVWTEKVFNKISNYIQEGVKNNENTLYLIDDLRLPNELDFFKGNLRKIRDIVGSDHSVKITAIRIEKYVDPNNFVEGVDNDNTETSFDNLVNICFDYIVPPQVLINQSGYPNFDNVEVISKTVVTNFLK
ncbi:hypothetical protein [Mycoplasmopsis pullorum]|uniref:Phosphomevalonate kinase n=1 Tax=Mycoplasmopsis pullorum TaxID=48003 RepID=A0A1L4FRM1_9BACT|nr:hypothetical protein [Mycoplasmopsis pullorum]APJ38256.1 hypothetical protein BLA55_00975 [Mycoplasmopsis pullorum]